MFIRVITYKGNPNDYCERHNIELTNDTPYEGKQRVAVEINGEKALVEVDELLASLQAIKAVAAY